MTEDEISQNRKELEALAMSYADLASVFIIIIHGVKTIDYLHQENKQLKDNYCNRTDCTGRIKDSKKYKSIQGRVEELENTLREIQKYCNYLHNDRKYDLNDGHIRKIRNICKRELEKNKEIKSGNN